MRALVTGGAGFIGSHLADRLVADGHRVTVVDDLSHGQARNLASATASGRCELVKLEVTDPDLLAVVRSAEPDVIVHLSAQIDVRVSVADPLRDVTANVVGTVAVLEAARCANVPKVVLASSVAIFGPPQRLPVREDTPTRPLSPYAASKLAAELYLRQYHDLHGLDTTALVLTNTYGPRQDPHGEAGVVAIFADAMLAGRPTRVFGEGRNVRDYLYVADAVDAFVRAAGLAGAAGSSGRPPVAGRRITVGTGEAVTDLELNRAVAEAVGGAPQPEYAPPRLGDLPAMVVDASAAADLLGWRPRTPLAEGLARTVAAMREG
jgi:UDP-glucose 4-epimerase